MKLDKVDELGKGIRVLIGPCGIETTQKLRICQGWSVLIGPCGIETSFRKECDSVFYKY